MGNKYNGLKLVYTCPASCPSDIFIDRLYTLQESDNELMLTDGNYVKKFNKEDLWYIKMLFSPKDTTWDKVELTEKIEKVATVKNNLKK